MNTSQSTTVRSTSSPFKRLSRPQHIALLVVLLIVVAVTIATAIWLIPYQPSAEATAALHSTSAVTVTQNDEMIAFVPRVQAHIGLIFYPGAKVVPAAYAIIMEQLAEHGYATFIAKMPLNIAFLGQNRADDIISSYSYIKIWSIGGHSLGGVVACSYAASHHNIKGLLLYASYPASDMSHDTWLSVVSIYGTHDGLATPDTINANKKLLPAMTSYLAIQGGIHSYFGDYGHQDGDGQATISREQARSEIIADSVSFLSHLQT